MFISLKPVSMAYLWPFVFFNGVQRMSDKISPTKIIPNNLMNRGNTIVICPSCSASFPLSIFGWVSVECPICQSRISHPSKTPTGHSAHGSQSKNVTVRLSPNIITHLDQLAKEHDTSRGGMTRYLIQIAMQGRQ